MEYRRFGTKLVLRLERGEEVCASLLALAAREDIRLAAVSGLGATNDATLGVFDTGTKTYHSVRYDAEDYEIAALTGNLTRMDGAPYLHVHAVLGSPRAGVCHGGHLNAAVVSATAELIVDVLDGEVGRRFSGEIGLNLLDF